MLKNYGENVTADDTADACTLYIIASITELCSVATGYSESLAPDRIDRYQTGKLKGLAGARA